LDREKELRRDDLVFPILYIDVDELQDETRWRGHSLLEVIGQRQYVDWREYRYELEGPALRRAVASLCTKITIALRRPPPNEESEADDRAAVQQEVERAKRRAEQEQAFARARGADTVAAISAFISTYPESHLAGDAQNAKAKLLARDEAHGRAMANDDPIVLESFLNSYRNGPRADEVRARLRKLQLKADDDIRLADARRRAEAEQQKEERERAEKIQRGKGPQKEESPKINEEADRRTTTPAPSNIRFLRIVCALLALQGIGRFVIAIIFMFFPPVDITDILILVGWGAAEVVIAFGITRQRVWAGVLGLIIVGISALLDGYVAVVNMDTTTVSFTLYAVIDVVVLICLIRDLPSLRKA
jgi:hypothetical protein